MPESEAREIIHDLKREGVSPDAQWAVLHEKLRDNVDSSAELFMKGSTSQANALVRECTILIVRMLELEVA